MSESLSIFPFGAINKVGLYELIDSRAGKILARKDHLKNWSLRLRIWSSARMPNSADNMKIFLSYRIEKKNYNSWAIYSYTATGN